MTYHLLPAICLATAISAPACLSAAEYNDPASTYPGMELLEPDEENLPLCQELPLMENFSNPNHYDGTSVLPIGWASTGTAVWCTASTGALPASSGEYYMIVPASDLPRDERAYTPFFLLEKGLTYTISFMTHQEGTVINGTSLMNKINLRVGTQQDAEFIPVTIGSISKNDKAGEWNKHSYTFSPAESGPYCFCFELSGSAYSGFAAIDDVRITSSIHQERVEPLFSPQSIFSAESGAVISMGNAPTRMIHYVNNGAPTGWQVDGASSEMTENGDGLVYFTRSGEYDVTLSASNATSESQLTKTINIEHFDNAGDRLIFVSYDPTTSKTIGRGEIPAFSSDPYGLDFVTGPNHYYSAMAEYFPAPAEAQLSISAFEFHLTNLRYVPAQQVVDEDSSKPVKVKFYGVDENGCPDESNTFASFTFTMREVFGIAVGSFTGDYLTLKLPRPVTVKGPFFIGIEYSEKICIDPLDPNVGRSFVSMGVAKHIHNRSSLYCKPYKAPPFTNIALDEWCPVSDLEPNFAGTGLALKVISSYVPGYLGVDLPDVISDTSCRLAGRSLTIETQEPAHVTIFTLDGIRSMTCNAAAGTNSIDVSALSAGMYIVRVGNNSFRIAIK